MEHKIIYCTVSEEYIIGAGECIGRAGSHDETALVLEFRDIWRGLSKTLFWTNADGTNGTMQILTPDMLQGGAETYRVPVPYGAKTRAGWAKLTIRGVMVEGETETVCAVAEGEFEVKEAEMPEDYREQLDIDATAAEQIMQSLEGLKTQIKDAGVIGAVLEPITDNPGARVVTSDGYIIADENGKSITTMEV